MAVIETKYSVGDKLWTFGTRHETKHIQCPDCLGTLRWTIRFADGHNEECPCQTCSRSWEGPRGKISYQEWVPLVEQVTIKDVRFGSEGAEYYANYFYTSDSGEPHMATQRYRDSELFESEADAQVAAQVEYEKRMAYLADNNFPKKGDFAKALERSTFGYSRCAALEETRRLKQWLDMTRPLRPKQKHLRQFDGDHAEKKPRKKANG